jgi:hypothetical protein
MSKGAKLLTVVLSLTLLVSLTLACTLPGLGGAVTEEETPAPPPPAEETPEVPPPAGETPEAPPPVELPFEMDVEALKNLNSYAYTFNFGGLSTTQGEVEHSSLHIEGQRQTQPTRVEQLSFSSVTDGESTSTDFIYIEEQNKIWARDDGGQWEELPIMDPSMPNIFDAFSVFSWWNTLFTGDPEDAQYLGQEMMNGVETHHYRAAEAASWGFAAGCTFASVRDDIWVAVDGSFPVKRQLDAVGDCEGETGEVHFLMEVSNVNQPVNVSPPM